MMFGKVEVKRAFQGGLARALPLAIAISSLNHAMAQDASDNKTPTKAQLIETLKSVLPLLQSKEFEKAAEHFVVPPNFQPQMLDGFIERQEISLDGILALEELAEFGKAEKVFGLERAENLAKRAGVDLNDCYGFQFESAGVTAEVMALWDNSRFRLARMDDIGKLSKPSSSSPQPTSSPDPTAQPSVEQVMQSLPLLAAAVESNPQNVTARAEYALALYRTENLPAAWQQLLAAFKIDSNHAGIARGLETVWTAFEQRGVFTVGIPQESIEGILGEPTQLLSLGSGKRCVYGFYGIDLVEGKLHETIDLRRATEALFRPTEIVVAELDGRGWQVGNRSKAAGYSTALLYVPGESIQSWTERIEIQRILNGANLGSTSDIANSLDQQVRSISPESNTKVLIEEDNAVTIAVKIVIAQSGEERHQLVRFLKGPVDLHRMSYTFIGKEPSAEVQKKWLAIFQSAVLQSVQIAGEANDSK